jgi:hypothetical protein
MAYDLRRAAARVASMCEWVAFALTGTVADFQVDLVRPALSTACVQPSSMAL